MSYEVPNILRPLSVASKNDLAFVMGVKEEFPSLEVTPYANATLGVPVLDPADVEATFKTSYTDGQKEDRVRTLTCRPLPFSFNETISVAVAGVAYIAKEGGGEFVDSYDLALTFDDAADNLEKEFRHLWTRGRKYIERSEPFLHVSVARVGMSSALDGLLDWLYDKKPKTLTLLPVTAPPYIIPPSREAPANTSRQQPPDITIRRIDTSLRPSAGRMPGPPRPRSISAVPKI
jgi:hypothetical protein